MMQLIYISRLLLSCLLSFIIGYEREIQDKTAGLRTIMLVCLGSTAFTLLSFVLIPISKELGFTFSFTRIISYIIGGIGFLAGVVIFHGKHKVEGITTSASIWATVSVGILVGLGEFILAIVVTLLIYLILKLKYVKIKIQIIKKQRGRNGKKK